jgi:hypothetical protein
MKQVLLFSLLLFCFGCSQNSSNQENNKQETLTEAPKSKAAQIADEVMEAMGGQAAYDATRYLAWNFFGFRHLLWDKHTGDVRISMKNDSTIYIVNINDNSGMVKQDGQILTHPDSLSKYLERAKNIWINDSYWLVMPYKLQDPGVNLAYIGEDTMKGGVNADVLELTYNEVGKTPENKYLVYVDKNTRMIGQWDYFKNATDSIPRLSTPWGEWKKMGNIMLSEDRGDRDLSDVEVLESVPANAFKALEPLK